MLPLPKIRAGKSKHTIIFLKFLENTTCQVFAFKFLGMIGKNCLVFSQNALALHTFISVYVFSTKKY